MPVQPQVADGWQPCWGTCGSGCSAVEQVSEARTQSDGGKPVAVHAREQASNGFRGVHVQRNQPCIQEGPKQHASSAVAADKQRLGLSTPRVGCAAAILFYIVAL